MMAQADHEAQAFEMVNSHNRLTASDGLPVGVLTPLTGPGDPTAGALAVRGAVLGARFAAEQGVGPGVRLILANDQLGADKEHMSRTAVGGLAKLAFIDRVSAVVGQWHLRTVPTVAAAAEEIGLPIFIENGHNTVTDNRRFVFRTYFSIADRAPLIASFVQQRGWRRVAIVAADTVFGSMLADSAAEELRKAVEGVRIERVDFDQDRVTSLDAELQRTARFAPDVLLNLGVVRTNYMVIAAGAKAGMLPGVPMIVGFPFPMRSDDYWKLAGEAGVGVVWPATRFRPNWAGLTSTGRWFAERFQAEFGSAPPDNSLNAFTDVVILSQAAAVAGSSERVAIHRALETQTFDTWRGPVAFPWGGDMSHHQPPEIVLTQYQDFGNTPDDALVVWPPAAVAATYGTDRNSG